MERVQLREGALKHKTEVETLVLEHQAELTAVRAAYDAQLATAQQQAAQLQQQLEDTEARLAVAQVKRCHGQQLACAEPSLGCSSELLVVLAECMGKHVGVKEVHEKV